MHVTGGHGFYGTLYICVSNATKFYYRLFRGSLMPWSRSERRSTDSSGACPGTQEPYTLLRHITSCQDEADISIFHLGFPMIWNTAYNKRNSSLRSSAPGLPASNLHQMLMHHSKAAPAATDAHHSTMVNPLGPHLSHFQLESDKVHCVMAITVTSLSSPPVWFCYPLTEGNSWWLVVLQLGVIQQLQKKMTE